MEKIKVKRDIKPTQSKDPKNNNSTLVRCTDPTKVFVSSTSCRLLNARNTYARGGMLHRTKLKNVQNILEFEGELKSPELTQNNGDKITAK